MKKHLLFLLLLVMISASVWSQSRLIGVMPMQFNPSFAGTAGGPRIALLISYDYAESKTLKTQTIRGTSYQGTILPFKLNKPLFSISYDNFIPSLSCGIGAYASAENERQEKYFFDTRHQKINGIKCGMIISPKISLKGKWTISPSIGINYKHLFYEYRVTVLNYIGKHSYNVFYFNAGILINTDNFYIGYAYNFHTINKRYNPALFYEDYLFTQGYPGIKEPQDKIQIGYRFQRRQNSKTSYSLQAILPVNYYKKIKWHNPDISFTFRYKRLISGANVFTQGQFYYEYQKDVNVAGFIGYQTKRFKIMYSQNILKLSSKFYSELSVRFNLPRKRDSGMSNFD